jgi:acetyl esterase/lipase
MTKEERDGHLTMRKVWKFLAADMEKQKGDPLLFPGKASTEILEKFPPTIIVEAEFDMFITEATRLAYKLRAAGRLLEFIVIPGSKHGSYMLPAFKCFKTGIDAYKLAWQEYVDN